MTKEEKIKELEEIHAGPKLAWTTCENFYLMKMKDLMDKSEDKHDFIRDLLKEFEG